jgi:hypothetical protein
LSNSYENARDSHKQNNIEENNEFEGVTHSNHNNGLIFDQNAMTN